MVNKRLANLQEWVNNSIKNLTKLEAIAKDLTHRFQPDQKTINQNFFDMSKLFVT